MKPFISIVTGTYNRLAHLRRMVDSARASLPVGVPYEFVIVDGGSTDGTIEWCESQPDVVLIHGDLSGAIKAFDTGTEAAQAPYVLLANDDVELVGDGILRALVHLETHPTCGAVAFLDNRPAPGYADGYKVQVISARDPQGTPLSVPYAQVGLFRRWLADAAGWWGSKDPVMAKARTYGGDSYLSARIWELGYTVDTVRNVMVNDLLVEDELRARNTSSEPTPSPFYERYPQGPMLAPTPTIEPPATAAPRLRVLYAPIYERRNTAQQANKHGLRDALARAFFVYELDYVNRDFDLPALVNTFKPDVLFTQVHGSSGRITPQLLAQVREVNPRMLVVNWNGDVHEEALIGKAALEYLKNVDLQLVVNANVLDRYRELGIHAAYWQVSYEPLETELPTVPGHDVLFLANNYSPTRRALGTFLRGIPYNVGIYGAGWPFADGNTLYDFAASAALIKSAKINIGDNQYAGYGFVSNRVFETLAHGGFLLHQRVEGMDMLLGLQDGVHYVEWEDSSDLQSKIEYWLKPKQEKARQEIASKGQKFVLTFHSFDARVRELFLEIVPREFEAQRVGV